MASDLSFISARTVCGTNNEAGPIEVLSVVELLTMDLLDRAGSVGGKGGKGVGGIDIERARIFSRASCDSVDEKDSEFVISPSPKMDAMVESVVDAEVDKALEAADIVDEKDRETGRVGGGDDPPNNEDVNMSIPLAFGDRGCGNG